jgi:release factor glutamine methyltransferase
MVLLRWAAGYLKNRGIDSPRATAEILLAHALATDRLRLYLDHDKPLSPAELARFKALLLRRLNREPVAYIVGRKGFWTLDLAVTPAVLIPRPETERLVAAAIDWLAKAEGGRELRVLELGTGSGAVVLAIAAEPGRRRHFATDRCPAALAVARENARRTGLAAAVAFAAADWFDAFRAAAPPFDLIVSNPPYIARGAIDALQPEIAGFEPRLALDGGPDGLECHRRIIAGAAARLAPGGALMLEIGCDQRQAVCALAEAAGVFSGCRCLPDFSGRDRVVILEKKVANPQGSCYK